MGFFTSAWTLEEIYFGPADEQQWKCVFGNRGVSLINSGHCSPSVKSPSGSWPPFSQNHLSQFVTFHCGSTKYKNCDYLSLYLKKEKIHRIKKRANKRENCINMKRCEKRSWKWIHVILWIIMDKNRATWLESIFFRFHILALFCREIREHILVIYGGGCRKLLISCRRQCNKESGAVSVCPPVSSYLR